VTPGRGKRAEGGPPRAAMATAMGARGELGSGRGRERHGLGEVDEVMEMLTSKGIAPRWTGGGDRRGGFVLGEEQRRMELKQGGRRAAELGSSESLGWRWAAAGGGFYRRRRRSCANAPLLVINGGAVAGWQLASVACGAVALR